jgi:integrase
MSEAIARRRHRGANEGSITRRSDGRWEAKISAGWKDGKRRRISVYGATRAEVAERLNKLLREQAQGLPVDPGRQTVTCFLARWLEECVKPSVRPLSYEQYEQHVRLYLAPVLGSTVLAKLTPEQVQAFINKMLARGLSARTVQLSLVTLKRALKQAERWNLVARNVAKLVDAPRVERHKAEPLDPEQSKRLLEAAKSSERGALFTTMLLCGMRLGEALALSWQQVDFERQTLTIERSLARVGRRTGSSKLIYQEPKTEQSRRVLHMPALVVAALREQRRRQAELRLHVGADWQDRGLVFTTSKGTPLEAANVHREWKRLLATAGLPTSVRLHDLRHSSASLLLNLGVPLKVIQQILGHSSIKVTADIYAHLAPQMQRDAADALDALMGS